MGLIHRQIASSGDLVRTPFSSVMFDETRNFAFEGGRGRLLTDHLRLDRAGYRVSRVRSSGHVIGVEEADNATLLFPQAGRLDVRMGRQEAEISAGSLGFVRPNARTTRARAARGAQFVGLVLMLPMRQITATAQMAGLKTLGLPDLQSVQNPVAHRIAGYLEFLLTDASIHPDQTQTTSATDRTLARIEAHLCDLLAELLETMEALQRGSVGDGVKGQDWMRVRRAEEILQAQADEAISIAEVARDLGVGLRSLQSAFRGIYGEGPKSRLTRIRLEKARQRLMSAEPGAQVTVIAMDCGFTHLGRFSEAYFRAFGERPKDTLSSQHRAAYR